MNPDVITALISSSAALLTAVVALVLNHRAFTGLENRITAMDSSTNARFIAIENRLHGDMQDLRTDMKDMRSDVREDIKLLTGKVIEVDNRLTRLEERLGK